MNDSLFAYATAALVFVALLKALFSMSKTIHKVPPRIGIRGYSVIYTDQEQGRKNNSTYKNKKDDIVYSKILRAQTHCLSGKPDYIFQKNNGTDIVPVELKSGTIGDKQQPNTGDMMQLVSYFIIIEEYYGIRPRNGRLIYRDAMFIIKNTAALRHELLSIVDRMRDMLETGDEDVEPGFAKCRYCICRDTVCEYCDTH